MSERPLDADLKTSATGPEFSYLVFVELAFPSGTVYVHNGTGKYSFGGNTYLGVGAFGNISPIQETQDLHDSPIKLTLSAITPAIIDAVKTDDVYGRDADIYVGHVNRDMQLVGTPTNWISGFMELVELSIGDNDALSISVQSRAAKLQRRNNRRYTMADHQIDYPGDTFFEFLPYVVDAKVFWGGERVRTGFKSNDGLSGDGRADNPFGGPGPGLTLRF